MTAKNKTTKFISAFLIISILLPSVLFSRPQPAEAQGMVPVLDKAATKILGKIAGSSGSTNLTTLKEWAVYIGKELLKVAAKRLLAKMTQATINWINSDFHGAPLFLENPESFFKDIAKSEVKNLVDMIGYDTFRFPFGKQTALNVISSYKSQLETNAQYSLSKVINDPDLLVRYRNDFNYGGWNGFLINTQYPQNNYLGFQMIIQQNLASRVQGTLQAPAQKVQSMLQQGMGFLSPQTCPDNPAYNNGVNEFQKPSYKSKITPNIPEPVYVTDDDVSDLPMVTNQAEIDRATAQFKAEDATAKAEWAKTNTCPGGLKNTTPGSVAANQIFNALDTPRESATLAGALGNSVVDSVGAIFDALINHFLDKGLTALASTVSSSSGEDNWTYNGQTLDGSTPSGTPTALNIPQNVSVTVGEVASTAISGGTAPYSIQTQPNIGIATARIDFTGSGNPTLAVTGITPGQTFLIVQDSSTPSKTVAIQIAINAIGALVINPHNILTDTNDTVIATISGGQEPYFIQTSPNQSVAIVSLSSTGLIVSGIGAGQTSVVVRDSSTPVKTTVAQITTNGTVDLVVPDVSVAVGQTVNTTISGGVAPYSIETQNFTSANVRIEGSNLVVTGIAPGQIVLVIEDSSTKLTATNITISDNRFLTVSPEDVSLTMGHMVNATISGGIAPYSIKTVPRTDRATAQITNNSLKITAGTNNGGTYLIIKDSSTPNPQTFRVNITLR